MTASAGYYHADDRGRAESAQFVSAIIFTLTAFFLPMKAFAVNAGGLSIYLPYLGLFFACAFMLSGVLKVIAQYFVWPMTVIFSLSLFYYWQTGFHADVFVFDAKIGAMLAMSALYILSLRSDEKRLTDYLFAGIAVSVVYMIYQGVSLQLFGGGLPFTSIDFFEIGRGLGSRYGFVRTTGFTEEPSYIAVILVGSGLLFRSYQIRTGEVQTRRYWVILLGLMLCTSNSLFATVPLLLLFSLFYSIRAPFLFFVAFYALNLAVAPAVINIDETFFARFSSYEQFVRLPPWQWLTGTGFNQYSSLQFPVFVNEDGIATMVVDSIASLWGGVLLEGGIFFALLFCLYLSRITQVAKSGTGFALMAILIMLANYYSPWWPIVSLALAYALVSRESPEEAA